MSAFVTTMTSDRQLPNGCDSWGFRLNQAGGESRNGFVWPREGWVEAPGPVLDDNRDGCPAYVGDGICAAIDWDGVYLDYPPGEIALIAWSKADRVGSSVKKKVRLRRAYVAAVVPLRLADLRGARMTDANLHQADLRGVNLHGADLYLANMHGADLSGADLNGAYMSMARLDRANLSGARLLRANLHEADLSGADLRGADLRGAVLCRADLSDADLRDADLRGADLRGADLTGADLTGALRSD